MSTIDILSIHNTLLRKYQHADHMEKEKEDDEYSKWKDLYKTYYSTDHSPLVIQDIESKLKCMEEHRKKNDHRFYFYLLRAIPLLDEYRRLKKNQSKIHFISHQSSLEEHENPSMEMKDIVKEYLNVMEHYYPEEFETNDWKQIMLRDKLQKSVCRVKCSNCEDEESFSIYDNHFVCEKCGLVTSNTQNTISYKDIDRVNISSKYTYDRRTHFRDCINQFQGKQNSTIDPKVYQDLIEQFLLHGLLVKDYESQPKEVAFQNISKEHVLIFLKETGHSKHYEDVVLIHHQLTGKPAPDISHLENVLLRDFDSLTDLYDKKHKNKHSERKNFINTQYVLYQLLRRHKYPCKKEDFNILKTVDRKYYHDNICADLFQTLGWNFQALF